MQALSKQSPGPGVQDELMKLPAVQCTSLLNVHVLGHLNTFDSEIPQYLYLHTTHQSAGLGNRVQLQLSGSKFTADHALATGQPWPLLLFHSEKMFSTVKVICSDFGWGKKVCYNKYMPFWQNCNELKHSLQ